MEKAILSRYLCTRFQEREQTTKDAGTRSLEASKKKFEKTLKKIWKYKEKRFIFASAFASKKWSKCKTEKEEFFKILK